MRATRERAARIAGEIAARLVDPTGVVTAVLAPDNLDRNPGSPPRHPWRPGSLASGHPGIALLFGELGGADGRATMHAHLSAAVTGLHAGDTGLFGGLAGIGIAASFGARRPGEYAGLLREIDDRVAAEVEALLEPERSRLAAGVAGTRMGSFDLISGVTGLGRYLLHRRETAGTLVAILDYLVGLTEPITVGGTTMAGWWTPGSPSLITREDPRYTMGHFNIGQAHGIAGPLALLALAYEAGVTVPGHEAAMDRICSWLRSQLRIGNGYAYWPSAVSLVEEVAGVPNGPSGDRSAWCYGTPGVAHSLHLAGRALDRPALRQEALDLLWHSIDRAERAGALGDANLCHGWGGLLTIVCQVAGHDNSRPWQRLADRLAERTMSWCVPQVPFGVRHDPRHGKLARDRPGLLEGAAGVALALHGYAIADVGGPGAAVLLLG
ncbi:Lanthionine synthetase C-like protein [Micromonospora viridifaciens]|uniref:Lanthionine synthetase C-like protein n=1 Tax=Micromonospora viridifaciens TaxID=1881 RepID=A0A1C4YJQ9_MICVI|nr:lanthionine synthetase C family protein [Micromonospora viridifaciens]SCF20571.1 Lanthionine synthetase C-like protein [Micromonospora viridifaciens]